MLEMHEAYTRTLMRGIRRNVLMYAVCASSDKLFCVLRKLLCGSEIGDWFVLSWQQRGRRCDEG